MDSNSNVINIRIECGNLLKRQQNEHTLIANTFYNNKMVEATKTHSTHTLNGQKKKKLVERNKLRSNDVIH